MNHVFEQEDTEGSTEVMNTKGNRSRPTTPSKYREEPSTSQTQMLERQLIMEVYSFSRPADRHQDMKERYQKIKARNERLKAQSYAQYLKLTPTNQIRLMSSFHIKESKLQISFIKPTT